MSAQMLEVSLLGVGTVLHLEKDAWSMVKRLRQATNECALAHSPLSRPSLMETPSVGISSPTGAYREHSSPTPCHGRPVMALGGQGLRGVTSGKCERIDHIHIRRRSEVGWGGLSVRFP